MPILNRLTVRGAAAISKPGRHADGGNLYLNISKSGARSWVFFYRREGKQREMGLGPAGPGGVSLAEARIAAAAQRTLLLQGSDPLEARAIAKAEAKAKAEGRVTFGEFAALYIGMHEPHWKNDKHAAQWRSTILGPQVAPTTKRKAMPDYCAAIRNRPIADIDTTDVLDVIKPWWGVKRETASRIR